MILTLLILADYLYKIHEAEPNEQIHLIEFFYFLFPLSGLLVFLKNKIWRLN